MGTFQLEITFDRPCDDAFAVIADPTTMPVWYEAVEHVTRTSAGPAATGATYEITRSLPGGKAHNTVEITEHEAHHRVTLESCDGPTPFRYCYTLQPRPDEATSVVLDGRISGAGLPGPVGRLDPLATQLFKRGMRRNLAELKRVIESLRGDTTTPDISSNRSLRPEPLTRDPAAPAATTTTPRDCTPNGRDADEHHPGAGVILRFRHSMGPAVGRLNEISAVHVYARPLASVGGAGLVAACRPPVVAA